METLRVVLTHFDEEILGILLALLVSLLTLLASFWLYNRKKFRKLAHQIPASVVKNYLDSIISNSRALRSSLYLDGDQDSGPHVPSVVSTGQLPKGGVHPAPTTTREEMVLKEAEIASLRLQVGEKNKIVDELEGMLSTSTPAGAGSDVLERENAELKNKLEKLKSELTQSTSSQDLLKERNKLKDRLAEYEVIEEDLANLKRFQEENKELKQTVERLKLSSHKEAPHKKEDPDPHVPLQEADEHEKEGILEMKSGSTRKKSAEELLSEFEKMLG